MSRIGRLPIDIPAGVEVKIEEGNKVPAERFFLEFMIILMIFIIKIRN